MTAKRILAFDFGAESGRAIMGELEGGKLRLHELHRFPTGFVEVNGKCLLNVLSFYEEILAGLKKYVREFGQVLDSIGIDTWGCDFGLLDGQGNLLAVPYSYRDSKTNETDKIIQKKMGKDRLYSETGIQMLQINTLNQLIALKERERTVVDHASHLIYLGDLLHYFLTGQITMSYTVNSISQLYNPVKQAWADEVFEAFGLPRRIQGDMIYPGQRVGMLDGQIAAECGLDPVPVTAPCIHDTASAAVAAPGGGEGAAILSSGTWSIACLDLDRVVVNEKARELSISNSGFAFGRNLFAKNVMGLWVLQCCKREWQKKNPGISYPEIAEAAEKAQPFTRWLDIDDELFFNPDTMCGAIRSYFAKTGQKPLGEDQIAETARTIYESLAMKYRRNFDKMAEAAGFEIRELNIIGGGCNNRFLNQLTANVMKVPVMAGPGEATAAGNIMIQAAGLGLFGSLDEIREVIRNSFPIEYFLPEDVDVWEKRYQFYRERVFHG